MTLDLHVMSDTFQQTTLRPGEPQRNSNLHSRNHFISAQVFYLRTRRRSERSANSKTDAL